MTDRARAVILTGVGSLLLLPLVAQPRLLDRRIASPVDNIAFPPLGLVLAQGVIVVAAVLLAGWRPATVNGLWQRILRIPRPMFLGGAAAFVLVVALVICLVVLDRYPHDVDDFARIFQARTLASGRISVPAPPEVAAFNVPHVVVFRDRMFSRYEPGTALLYAVWYSVFGVMWGVNAVLGAGVVAAVYETVRCWHGEGTARLTVLCLCLSPFFVLMSSGFQTHLPTLFFVSLFLLALTKAHLGASSGWLVGAGLALGFALATRSYTTPLVTAPFVAWFVLATGRLADTVRRALLLTLGLAVPVALLLCYNAALTGRPLLPPHLLVPGAEFGFVRGHSPWRAVRNTAVMVEILDLNLLGWPISLLFPVLFVAAGPKNCWDRLCIAATACLMLGHALFYWIDFSFGPRYYFEVTPLLVVLVARGMASGPASVLRWAGLTAEPPRLRAFAGYVAMLSFLFSVTFYIGPLLSKFGDDYGGFVDSRVESLAAAHGLRHAIVFMRQPPGLHVYQSGFLANALDFNGDVVYARDRGPSLNARTLEAYPGRTPFLFEYDRDAGGRFSPYRGQPDQTGENRHGR